MRLSCILSVETRREKSHFSFLVKHEVEEVDIFSELLSL